MLACDITSPVHPKRLWLPSASGTCVGCLIRSADGCIQPVIGRGPWSSVDLPGGVRRRRETLPGSWETPVHACPALRPRWADFSLPSREKSVLPSGLRKPSAPRDVTFEAQSRSLMSASDMTCSLSTLHSAGRPDTAQDSLPACWLGIGWTGLSPVGFRNRISRSL